MEEGSVAEVYLDLRIDASSITTQINRAVYDATRQATDAFSGMNRNATRQITGLTRNATRQAASMFSGMGKKLLGVFSTVAVAGFTKQCIALGSDLAEVQNVVDTAFGSMSGEADKFAKDAMTNFGLSETAAKKYMGVFGQMSSAMGITGQASLDMAKNVTALTGDVASFYNLNMDEAYTKLKSIWTGETETLKELGVVMTQTNLDQYALNNGFGKTTAKMTEQEKVMLRYQYVTSALSNATGDFIKTQDGWANQTRVLALRFEQLKATLGQGFIALFMPIIKGINSCLAGLQKLADGFTGFVTALTGADISSSTGSIMSGLTEIGDDALSAAENISGIGDAAGDTAKEIERSLAGFDQITKLSEPQAESGNGSGTTGSVAGISASVLPSATGEASDLAKGFEDILAPLKNISFDNLTASLTRLKDAVVPLGSKAFAGLQWGYENVLVPLAHWTIETAAPAAVDILASSFDTLNIALEAAQPWLDCIWNDFLKPMGQWTGGLIVAALHAIKEGLDGIGTWIKNNQDVLNNSLGTYFQPMLQSAVKLVGSITQLLKDFYSVMIPLLQPVLDTMGRIFINLLNAVMKVVTGIMDVFSGLAEFLSGVFTLNWEKCLNGLVSILKGIVEIIWGIVQGALGPLIEMVSLGIDMGIKLFQDLWNGITSIFSGFTEWFTGIFVAGWEGMTNAFSSAGDFFIGIWHGITGAFGNVTGWFRDEFTQAWEAVKNVFSAGGEIFDGIKDGILNGLKGVINKLISGINKVIAIPFNGINDALNGIRKVNILGIKPFEWISTISVPQIPMLAQGGYVKPNTPQLAMIGDNRHQGEVVAPEDKLKAMALEAARMSSGGVLMAEAVQILKEILSVIKALDLDIQIDGISLKTYIVNKINEHTKSTGKCEIIS